MAFPAATWVDGIRYFAADLNSRVRDNFTQLRAGGIAIASQAANDYIYASSATQFARLAAVEGSSPTFTGGVWAMQPFSSGGDNASSVIASETFS